MKKLIVPIYILLVSASFFGAARTYAAAVPLSPPLITVVPKDLGNNEIWYIGGAVAVPEGEVTIYLQGERGEALSFTTRANERGEWFYTHTTFLREGKYRSWAQLRVGEELSPPGPEVRFEIVPTALRIGTYRVSFETLYLSVAIFLLLSILGAGGFSWHHFRGWREKRARLRKEVREAEEETRRGFALLRQDIQEEIAFIAQIKKSREISMEERRREEKLLQDLNLVERHIMEEIGDINPAIP